MTTRESVMPAETDYWVNLSNGQPLVVVHAAASEGLVDMLDWIFRSNEFEGRAVVREIFHKPDDFTTGR